MKLASGENIAWLISFILVLVTVFFSYQWLQTLEEKPAINILAAHDVPANGLPVYAQFIFTQTLRLQKPVLASKLNIPIYFPIKSDWLKIDLLQDNKLVQRWRVHPNFEDTVQNVALSINPPQKLNGDLEVVFSGSHIDNEFKDQAPRLFIETADYAYPDGNYRIADNEKSGDINMSLYDLRSNKELLAGKWQNNRTALFPMAVRWLVVLVMIIALPYGVVKSVLDRE